MAFFNPSGTESGASGVLILSALGESVKSIESRAIRVFVSSRESGEAIEEFEKGHRK
ncbi:hypothetical protein SBDP1_1560004 [Syntrophobacter sp. SbD1]|nr:hypothetical protein SBDP1_1560004 [Syntrophobacter sp. SbD1]